MAASEAEKQPGAPEGESPLATANAGHAQSLQVAEVWVSLTWPWCSGRHGVCSERALNCQDRFWRRVGYSKDLVYVWESQLIVLVTLWPMLSLVSCRGRPESVASP